MKNNRILYLIFIIIAIFMLSAGGVSAQDVDIENMDNEQLTTLLLQIMQRLDQSGEAAETPESTATPTPGPNVAPQPELSGDPTKPEALILPAKQKHQQEVSQEPETVPTEESPKDPVPTATMPPLPEPELIKFSIWENKKLIIEALPSYMFIQPTKQSKPDQEDQPENHYFGEPCSRPDVTNRPCYWVDWGGTWSCKCPKG